MTRFDNPLDNLRIASPCDSDWNEMLGDDRKRYCASCNLNVYNLSEMSQADAEGLLIRSEGRLCVRFYRRSDGSVLTRNCPVGWRSVRAQTVRTVGSFISLFFGILSSLVAIRAAESIISALPVGEVPAVNIDQDSNRSYDDPVVGEIATPKYVNPIMGEAVIPNDVRGRMFVGRKINSDC